MKIKDATTWEEYAEAVKDLITEAPSPNEVRFVHPLIVLAPEPFQSELFNFAKEEMAIYGWGPIEHLTNSDVDPEIQNPQHLFGNLLFYWEQK
jgi:hypothetical protein